MSSSKIQPKLTKNSNGSYLLYDASRIKNASMDLFCPNNKALLAQPVTHGGRQSAWFVQGEFGNAVLRHYRRGGLMAKINNKNYLWLGFNKTRSFAEFNVLSFMHEQGLAVPRPVAAMAIRNGLMYQAAILVETISNSITFAQLVQQGENNIDANVANSIIKSIHAMHEAGVWHADLNAYNILLDDTGKAWIIDFDKAVCGPVSNNKRLKNIERLQRSLLKVAPIQAKVWCNYIRQKYSAL